MALFGFIGVGNMGSSVLKASYKTFGHDNIIYFDQSKERCLDIKSSLNISPEKDNISLVNKSRYIILVVKPQYISNVLDEIKGHVKPDHIIISMVAGVSINAIKKALGNDIRVVRAMPNTPALILKGATGISFSLDSYSEDERALIDRFFSSFGEYEIFDEDLMNAVTCACGSSPAYVYTFIEALADSVVSLGIPRDKAYLLVAQTVMGAASMVLASNEHPGVLKDQVCSPAGTTIAAIKALEENGFRNAIMKATDACYNRANEMTLQSQTDK
ncbi:MAG: pyrroline-5-carboxylate reductase [Clostridiales bacterium]|jgi:pyrroline-5-carboxylate reductase|nr:pyrroline-5-carboxylate reductase [Bacillota bacterium]NLK04074.1 pyrroline-5-carboxylate reductase [Clostridiales bacterium]